MGLLMGGDLLALWFSLFCDHGPIRPEDSEGSCRGGSWLIGPGPAGLGPMGICICRVFAFWLAAVYRGPGAKD